MKNRYEALIVLNTKGKETTANDIIDRIESDFKKAGAAVEQIQRMDKRSFSYAAGELDSGYYVNFIFTGEPTLIDVLQKKFRHDEEIYRQNYLKLDAKKVAKA
jgi:ribosomal protein S6